MKVYKFSIEKEVKVIKDQKKYTRTAIFDTVLAHIISVDPRVIEKIYRFEVLHVDEVRWDYEKGILHCPYLVAELRDGSKFAIHERDARTIRHDYFGERV